nr:tetratricopeptide repeat protein [Bacteroidota bacterium]
MKLNTTFKTFASGLSFSLVALTSTGQTFQEGIAALDRERFVPAKEILKKVVAKEPANSKAWYYLGEAYLGLDLNDSAAGAYEKGIEKNVAEPLNYAGLGQVLLNTNKPVEAKAKLDQVQEMTKCKDYQSLLRVAKAYIHATQNKNLDNAMLVLNKAEKLAKNDPEFYLVKGDLYLEKYDGQNSAANYNQAISYNKNYVKPYVRMGKMYATVGNPAAAREKLVEAIKVDSMYAPAYKELAELEYQQRNYKQAAKYFKRYTELAGNTPEDRFRYAQSLFRSREYDAAMKEFESLTPLYSENPELHRWKGYTYNLLTQYDKSVVSLEKYFTVADTAKIAATDYNYLSNSLQKLGKDSFALMYLEKALTRKDATQDMYEQA